MKHFIFLILTVSTLTIARSQNKKVFLDKNFAPTNEAAAVYYRVVEQRADDYLVKDYYISGNIQSEMISQAIPTDERWTGDITIYYENGTKKSQGRFENGSRVGLHSYWYENGKPYKELFHEKTDVIYKQYWDVSGTPKLVNGNGTVIDDYGYLNETAYLTIQDGKIVLSYSIAPDTRDTVYNRPSQLPVYKGELAAITRDIKSELIYPRKARRLGASGKVYVSFIIDKQGKVIRPTAIKGVSEELDAEAVRTVATLNNWIPGKVDGRPVMTRYIIPINFKL